LSWAIETHSLTKRFPKGKGWRDLLSRQQLGPHIVNQIDLKVAQGELFGLLGPNGAGKTTLIKLLCTLIIPTSGNAYVNGYALEQDTAIRRNVGLVTSDERSFFWRLTAQQNLDFFARLYGLNDEQTQEQITFALEQVGLLNVAGQRFQFYSSGMRQRLSIARALLNQPDLLFMDEPSKGLDPAAVRKLHHLIRDLSDQNGITIFLTTHNLIEAEQLCQRIAIMNHGRILACGTAMELRDRLQLKSRYQVHVDHLNTGTQEKLSNNFEDLKTSPVETSSPNDSLFPDAVQLDIRAPDRGRSINDLVDILRQEEVTIRSINRLSASLEQVFTQLVESDENSEQPTRSLEEKLDERIYENLPLQKAPERSTTKQTLRIAWAFLKRDILSEASYRVSFILQLFNILFSVATFYFIAQLFGKAATPYLEAYGGDYFSFVLIGIAFSSYFGAGLSGFSSSIRRAQTTGTMEAMLTTPTNISTMILSSSLWQYTLTTIRVIVFLIIGSLIADLNLSEGNYAAALLILALTIITFSSIGIISASFIMIIKRGDPITWILNSMMGLLGGVYYPIAILPGGLQWLAKFLPVTYSLQAMRLALLQGASFSILAPNIIVLFLFSLVLVPLGLLSFRYAVRQAKIDGSLTHY